MQKLNQRCCAPLHRHIMWDKNRWKAKLWTVPCNYLSFVTIVSLTINDHNNTFVKIRNVQPSGMATQWYIEPAAPGTNPTVSLSFVVLQSMDESHRGLPHPHKRTHTRSRYDLNIWILQPDESQTQYAVWKRGELYFCISEHHMNHNVVKQKLHFQSRLPITVRTSIRRSSRTTQT